MGRREDVLLRLDSYYEAVVNPANSSGSGRSMSLKDRFRSSWAGRPSRSSYFIQLATTERSKQQLSVICQAAAANDLRAFNRLLDENPIYLNAQDDKGWTPLHHACKNNAVDVVTNLLQRKADLDIRDGVGGTALHLAVFTGSPVLIELLLKHGADHKRVCKRKFTPLHLAVQLKKHDCLKALLSCKIVDVDLDGEYETTPLHFAATIDDVEAAKILLEHGAFMCKRNAHGLSSIHFAAKSASKNVLNLFLDKAEEKGYSRAIVLSFEDKYKHSPLHAAINSGNSEPVQVCLEAGAHIDGIQEDGSTAVHLVCSQPGTLEILQLMNKLQPQRFAASLEVKDNNGMIPLHRAALFDFSNVADYLIKCGSPVDSPDCNGKTPFLAAASRQCWCTMAVLYSAGADETYKDIDNSNFLHLAIKSGGDLTEVWKCGSGSQKGKACCKLLNESDRFGCTPLHYASKAGNLQTLCNLLDQGAVITLKDHEKSNPLHFACRYGRVNTARCLLDSIQGSYVINDVNSEGKTPLHLASESGHVKVVALLMQRGALLHRDYNGNSPLHLAAKNSYTQTIKILLNVHPSLMNLENNDGNTALHEAAIANKPKSIELLLTLGAEILENKEMRTFLDISIERSNQEAAIAVVNHYRWQEILMLPSHILGTYTIGLVRYLPDVCLMALDRSTESSDHDPTSKEYSITYNFDLIRSDPDKPAITDQLANSDKKLQENEDRDNAHLPLAALTTMVKYERVQCLSHPVCLSFVRMKWAAVGFWLQMFNLLIYGLFLGCFTSVIILVGPPPLAFYTNMTQGNNTAEEIDVYKEKLSQNCVQMYLVLAFAGINLIKEIIQIIQQRWRYFLDFTNYIEWALYSATIVFAIPHIIGLTTDWAYNCGVAALFFSWVNLLLFLQRFEFFGIYVVMFKSILGTLLQVLIVFSILVFAFGVTFFAILRVEEGAGFSSVPLSVLTSVVMMVGEMNYLDNFVAAPIDGDPTTSHFSGMAFFILSMFLLLMAILLMNLLIGLAVGDIEGVQKNARLKRLAMQVEMVADMEKKLPMIILRCVDKKTVTNHPNDCVSTIRTWYGKLVRGSDNDPCASAERDELRGQITQQKNRLKALQAEMSSQTELLKLIVAKMEIQTESSHMDEGCQDESMGINLILKQASRKSGRWKTKSVSDTVKQSKVLSTWNKDGGLGRQTSHTRDTSHSPLNRIKLDITPVESGDEETDL